MTTLPQRIAETAAAAGATTAAVAVYDYEKALHFSHQGARWFHAASTIKAPLLLAVYKLAEEGRIRLDDTLHVRNRFHSLTGGIFRVSAIRDGDTEVHRRRGRSMRVRELARAMIVRSSNLATNRVASIKKDTEGVNKKGWDWCGRVRDLFTNARRAR
jgi:beta-lactamase class A